jgi:hypothetical protein
LPTFFPLCHACTGVSNNGKAEGLQRAVHTERYVSVRPISATQRVPRRAVHRNQWTIPSDCALHEER